MPRTRSFSLALFGLAIVSACRSDPTRTQDAAPAPASETAQPQDPAPASPHAGRVLAQHLGECVVIEGTTSGRKLGPELQAGDASIGIVLAQPHETTWNELPAGTRVRVRGRVAERDDLPVFVAREGEPIEHAGIPVPEGTDLEKARKRLVVEAEAVAVARPIADVERELLGKVGTTVALPGVLRSLNGHWWFSHDGVDIHLERREAIADWGELHGRAVTLHGTLARKPMPRLDQIVLKPDRDLADAFVLAIDRADDPPAPEIGSCETPR